MEGLIGKNRELSVQAENRDPVCVVVLESKLELKQILLKQLLLKSLLTKVVKICIFTDVTEMACKSHYQLM